MQGSGTEGGSPARFGAPGARSPEEGGSRRRRRHESAGEGNAREPGNASPASHRWGKKAMRWGLEIAVLGAAAAFVLLRAGGNEGQVGAVFDHLHWHWLFVSLGAEVVSITALSWLQQKILQVGRLPVRVRDLLPVTMASNAVAQSLPAGTLFAEGYAFRQYQRLGASRTLGVWAELSAGAIASAALAAVATAGAAMVGSSLKWSLLPALSVVLAGALVACFLFQRAPVLSRIISAVLGRLERVLPASLCRHLRSAEQATSRMDQFRPSTRVWLACLAAATLNWTMDAVVLVMGLLTVGAPVPWRGVVLCYAAAQLLVELPVTPGGLGLVEGGLVEVLTRFNVPFSLATAGTLMYRAVSYWFLLLVGWAAVGVLTVRNRRADRHEQQDSAPARSPAL